MRKKAALLTTMLVLSVSANALISEVQSKDEEYHRVCTMLAEDGEVPQDEIDLYMHFCLESVIELDEDDYIYDDSEAKIKR